MSPTMRGFLRSLSRGSSVTNLPPEEYHTITISEATPRASLSQDSIEIRIQVDQFDISSHNGPCRLHDPFSREDHKECDWYLGCCLRAEVYNKNRADEIFPKVKNYGSRLMDGLDWHDHKFDYPNINIDVLQGGYRANNASIYHIHWEQLERLQRNAWPGLVSEPVQVHVRRVLKTTPVEPPRTTRQDKEINILLVIARRLKRGHSELEDLSPAMVYRSIMKVKKLLQKERSHYSIHLEVVRPGSFQALQDHLARKRIAQGEGFFHLIHFDLHGEVNKEDEQRQNHGAYLRFANSKGKLEMVPATKIADLLHEHEISCVVLTACESGRSNKGDDANLCRIFAEGGVSHILAMSFEIHGQAIDILCDSFYHNLLVSGKTFSESARRARVDLFDRPEREGRTGQTRVLEDWFTPVAYVPKVEMPFIQKKQNRLSFSSSRLNVQDYGYPLAYSSSHESARSNISYNDYDAEMDVDILRIEEILMRVGNVLLRGPDVDKNSELIDRLLRAWVSTGLLGEYDRKDTSLDAGIFFSPKEDHDTTAKEILAHAKRISKKSISKKLRENYIEPRKAFEEKALRKAAIKLTGIDKLFPREKPGPEKAPALKAALERFDRFLDIVIMGPKSDVQDNLKVNDYKIPFLIIVAEDLDDVLTKKFPSLYPNLGLEAVFRDRPFDSFAF